MDIILLLLIAQIIFYIVQDQHIYVFGFIGLSILVQEYFSQKRMVYLLVPMAIIHIFYCLNLKQNTRSIHEGFRRKRRGKRFSKKGAKNTYKSSKNKTTKGTTSAYKSTKKGTVNTYNKSKRGIKKAKILKRLKKFNEDLKASTTALTKNINFVSSSLNNLISQSKKEDKEDETPTDTTHASANFNTDKYNETYDPNEDKATLP